MALCREQSVCRPCWLTIRVTEGEIMLTAQDLEINNPFPTFDQTKDRYTGDGSDQRNQTEDEIEEDIGSRLEDAN